MDPESREQSEKLRIWFERLARRDPELHAALKEKVGRVAESEAAGPQMDVLESFPEAPESAESFGEAPAVSGPGEVFETIVQEGRPALFVMNDEINPETPLTDDASRLMVARIVAAADRLNPLMPLIGRIDVVNHPAGYPYVGTGWLIAPGIVCTNRHVANLIGRRDGARFVFSRGRFDRAIEVSLNRRREKDWTSTTNDAVAIREILWIEPEQGPDMAFLRIDPPADGTRQTHIELAETDGERDQFIATIGYPARAYSDTIPDQQWMDRIYGGIYDVKRAAPGQLDNPGGRNSTYDCTTLGGASGSPVLDLATGKALALHFAGLYRIENYGVPVSVLRRTLRRPPWQGRGAGGNAETAASGPPPAPPPATAKATAVIPAGERSVTVTIPITISIGIGDPQAASAGAARPMSVEEAAAQMAVPARPGVRAVKAGYSLVHGDIIIVAAEPRDIEAVRASTPERHAGYPVEVRYATIDEQLGLDTGIQEAAAAIVYDDGRRSRPEFSFDEIQEEMNVIVHVGPEQSFPVLKDFTGRARTGLVGSMYQFFAAHVAEAIEGRLEAGIPVELVLDPLTRDPRRGETKPGEFDRSETFERWRSAFPFENIYVVKGNGGLIDTSYHIKVLVRDGTAFWLSSGNWTRSSQPFPDPQSGRASGNREWHVVVENERLSQVFENHIKADRDQCRELGGTPEAFGEAPIMVDVPDEMTDDVLAEAPVRTLDPLQVGGRIKVKPILTPDRRGRVYTDAVLDLIGSAQRQLVFQNQYIKIKKGMTGNLSDLVDALIERSRSIEDVRVILRSGDLADNVAELQRRGMDVMRCIRIVGNTHTKGIVADRERVLVGSQNWSSQALSTNRDASLLFDDRRIAEYFLEAFEIDWARARPPSLEQPSKPVLRAEGPAPPSGYTRMTLAEYLER